VVSPEDSALIAIREVATGTRGKAIKGCVVKRYEHRTPVMCPGFTVHLRDASGEVQVVFFSEAADMFRESTAMQVGSEVRLTGFEKKELTTEKELRYAPTAQRHKLVYNRMQGHEVKLVPKPSWPPAPTSVPAPAGDEPLTVADVSHQADKAIVSVRAFVLVAGDVLADPPKDWGGSGLFRRVLLTESLEQDAPRCFWALRGRKAQEATHSRLLCRRRILITKAHVSHATIDGRPQQILVGCHEWKHEP